MPADKLHVLPAFNGDNDALPKRHNQFMAAKGSLSFTPTAGAKAPACTQEMRELLWMKFDRPQLHSGLAYRDLVSDVFACEEFKPWLHAALGLRYEQARANGGQLNHEEGRSFDEVDRRGQYQFQGPPPAAAYGQQPRDGYAQGREESGHRDFQQRLGGDARGQYVGDSRDRLFQDRPPPPHHHAPPYPSFQDRPPPPHHHAPSYPPPPQHGQSWDRMRIPDSQFTSDSSRDNRLSANPFPRCIYVTFSTCTRRTGKGTRGGEEGGGMQAGHRRHAAAMRVGNTLATQGIARFRTAPRPPLITPPPIPTTPPLNRGIEGRPVLPPPPNSVEIGDTTIR